MSELEHLLFAVLVGLSAGCGYYLAYTAVWHLLRLLSALVALLREATR